MRYFRAIQSLLLFLILLLAAYGYELSGEQQRLMWLLGCLAAVIGLYIPRTSAAMLGWVLMLPLLAYLMVSSWMGIITGTGWLVLFVLPWLPLVGASLMSTVGQVTRELHLTRIIHEEDYGLQPYSNLPGLGFASQTFEHLYAANQRSAHRTGVLKITLTNLSLIKDLSEDDEYRALIEKVVDVLRRHLRKSDWMFHIAENQFLMLVNLGPIHQAGASVLLNKLLSGLEEIPRLQAAGTSVTLTRENLSIAEVMRQLDTPTTLGQAGAAKLEEAPSGT